MSFILDALKKSEAERRLGQTPSLQDADQTAMISGRKSNWVFPLLALLLVAVVAGWAWNQFIELEPTTVEPNTAVVKETALEVEVISEYRSPAATAKMNASRRSPIATYTPPPSAKTSEGMALPDTGKIISINSTADSVAGSSSAPTAPIEVPQISEAEEREQRLQRLRQQRESERAEDEALVAAVESRLAAEAASTSTEDAVRFRELSAAVRGAMPDIKVTTQVYALKPENRLAIINGKRYREGETITDGVILDEVLRRGVIVTYKQYRVLIGD